MNVAGINILAPNKEAKGDFLLNCRLNSENNYTKYCE